MAGDEGAARTGQSPGVELDSGNLVGEAPGLRAEVEEAVHRGREEGALPAGGVEDGVRGAAHRPEAERLRQPGGRVIGAQGARCLHSLSGEPPWTVSAKKGGFLKSLGRGLDTGRGDLLE